MIFFMKSEMNMPDTCNACGETLHPLMPQVPDPMTGERFAIATCPRCELGHTLPQPQDLAPYYTAQYYGKRHGATGGYCTARRLRLVRQALPGSPGRLLDIGCGDGSFLVAARAVGWQVAGTELNPAPARAAGLDVREAVEEYGGAAQFDCITMWHTLEHMRDIPSMLAQVAGLLKPEGRLIVAVPDFGGLQARLFGPAWLHADVPRHLYHFNRKALEYSLAVAGLTPHVWRHQEFEYDLLGWSQSALNRLQKHPNLFFYLLTGKRCDAGPASRFFAMAAGTVLTFLSLPALAVSTMLGRGGTLIVVAGGTQSPQDQTK